MIRLIFRWLLRVLFGFQVFGHSALKTAGPVLLIPNHVSWFDWLFLAVCLDRDWKFVVSTISAETSWVHRKIMINQRTFPIDTASPYAVKRMAEYLQGRGRLVLFAEGRLSRTGCLMKLFEGTGFLLHKTDARVITCYIRGAQRLCCSPNGEQKQWFPRVSLHFGPVLNPPKLENLTTAQARSRLTNWLRDEMVRQQFHTEMEFGARTIPAAILAAALRRPHHEALEDVNQRITYSRLLVAARLLSREFENNLRGEQSRVGVLLPNVNAMPITLLALWSLGKVPTIINYTTGQTTMLTCAQLAGLRHIITSKTFLERLKVKVDLLLDEGIDFVFIENVRAQLSRRKKMVAGLAGRFAPRSLLRTQALSDDPAVILFTSGSEGMPKAVELSHRNLLANIRQMLAVCDLQDWDRFFTALPLFHSFGLSVGTLLPLIRGSHVSLYPSPLHYRVVPTAFYHRDCSIMLGTNTFLNGYARKAHVQDFRSLRYMFAGAEKLQESTAHAWAQRFGVRVLEGYGATECSPCISVNTPLTPKFGSAGKLLPGIEYRLEPVEGVVEGGRMFVRGPNVMLRYLNAEADAKFKSLGGWYDTGDIVRVDEEGFVFIQGRLKRFAKISGEMVSLTAVEEALAGAFPQYGVRCQTAIVSRPDADKGEALLVVTNERRLQLDEVRRALRAKGLPNICLPREVKFIREIPKLGTGKVNQRELEKLL